MKESFEITALRMANLVLAGPRKGWLNDVRELAAGLIAESEPAVIPAPLAMDIPKPPKANKIDVHIRWMIRRDMPEVLEMETHSFEFPWTEEQFIRCLRQRNCIGQIAEFEERVIAFMIYELHKTKLHVLNLAVHHDFRWHSVGRQMIDKLKSKLSPQRRDRIMLEVRETNMPALQFFKALGFRALATLKDFYDDTTEDAIVMGCMCELEARH